MLKILLKCLKNLSALLSFYNKKVFSQVINSGNRKVIKKRPKVL